MKRSFILSVIALFIVTACIYSCSKSDYLEPTNRKSTTKSQYRPPKVDDLNAYLLDFKQKMQTRGNDDTMELDEAAWHLSSIANYDLGDVVSTYDDFYYDTLYYNINVENGKVSLSDLNSVYTQAVNDIPRSVNNLPLENKHIRFIGTDISNEGLVTMSILVSYGWNTHLWYFPDALAMDTTLSPYFGDNYCCDLDEFTDTLETVLNDLVAYHPSGGFSGATSLVIAKTVVFNWYEHLDPYNENNHISNSRLLALYITNNLCKEEFCWSN